MKTADQYSPEDLERFREIFAVDLEQYRAVKQRYTICLAVLGAVGLAVFIFAIRFYQQQWVGLGGLFLAGGVALVITYKFWSLQKQLHCPACHNPFIDGIKTFCPECGSNSLVKKSWLQGGYDCNSCGKWLLISKNRNFKYKACTNCGVFLDDDGV